MPHNRCLIMGDITPLISQFFYTNPHARCSVEWSWRFDHPQREKGNIMKLQVQNQIRNLALKGLGYKRIADMLNLSPDTVKSHLRRHPVTEGSSVCLQCGKPIEQRPNRKEKKYCSDKCRMAYWNTHQDEVNKQAYYTLVCKHCGKEFVSYGNKNRKYCSRTCYGEARKKSA